MGMKDTMIIGYDTYHDTLHKGKSVGAVVASLNATCTKYISVAHIHSTPQQELEDLMCPAITKAIRKSFKQAYGSEDQVKFTYIIVSKRINTRFFKMDNNQPTNPPSGTVVDDVVTLPERYDFFLVSQSVRQG